MAARGSWWCRRSVKPPSEMPEADDELNRDRWANWVCLENLPVMGWRVLVILKGLSWLACFQCRSIASLDACAKQRAF